MNWINVRILRHITSHIYTWWLVCNNWIYVCICRHLSNKIEYCSVIIILWTLYICLPSNFIIRHQSCQLITEHENPYFFFVALTIHLWQEMNNVVYCRIVLLPDFNSNGLRHQDWYEEWISFVLWQYIQSTCTNSPSNCNYGLIFH